MHSTHWWQPKVSVSGAVLWYSGPGIAGMGMGNFKNGFQCLAYEGHILHSLEPHRQFLIKIYFNS